jgi:hypothetical protein
MLGDVRSNNLQEENNAALHGALVTEIDFVDGDEASDVAAQNYQKHLEETLQNAAQGLSLRTIKGARVESVSVAEIKAEL